MKTYNTRLIFENEEDFLYWKNLLTTSMSAYNDISRIIFDSKCSLGLTQVHSIVYEPIREKYPTIPAQSVIKMYKDAISNLRSCKRKSCPVRYNPSMRLDKRLYSKLTPTSISLPSSKRNKRVIVKFQTYDKFNELASLYTMTDPLIFMKNDEIWLSVTFNVPSKPVVDETYLGVDLGIRRIFTTSDGLSYKGKELNALKRKIRYNRRKLQSVGSKSAKRKLKKLANKERNVNKNYTHLICNKILDTDKSVIVLEDLKGIKQKTSKFENGRKRTKHNNRISQVPLFMIKEILTYKATHVGKRVESVSPSYTSQIDCMTGKRDGQRKGCRYYSSSGLVYDADWNAAINIRNRKHSTSFDTPIDGKLNLVDRLQSISQKRQDSSPSRKPRPL